jgi:hypothetical protein
MLQEQVLCAEKTSEEKMKQINDLEKEKECLLSKLVQIECETEREVKTMTQAYERRLKDVVERALGMQKDIIWTKKEAEERMKDLTEKAQVNKCLIQKLQSAESIISEKEHFLERITHEKASLEGDLKKAVYAQKKLLEHNECLTTRLMELENGSAPVKLQQQMSDSHCERKATLREVLTDLADRIVDMKTVLEEIIKCKNVQLQRIGAIAERLSELDGEEMKLCYERQDVAALHDTQEDELAKAVGNLHLLEESQKKSYLMRMGFGSDDSEIHTMKENVDEVLSLVASCKMRMLEIDQQMKEIEEEKSVLMQQQSDALERKNEYVKYLTLLTLIF